MSCEDVLIGQNHKYIDPLWTSCNGMAHFLSKRRLHLCSKRDMVVECSSLISARLMSRRNFAYTQSAVCCIQPVRCAVGCSDRDRAFSSPLQYCLCLDVRLHSACQAVTVRRRGSRRGLFLSCSDTTIYSFKVYVRLLLHRVCFSLWQRAQLEKEESKRSRRCCIPRQLVAGPRPGAIVKM